MNADQDLFDQLERYANGELSPEEALALENRMAQDEAFQKKASEHLLFLQSLRQHADRSKLKNVLDQAHDNTIAEMSRAKTEALPKAATKRYWPILAVAASVALISVVTTFLALQSVDKEPTTGYRELRRSVEKIEKSQRVIMADIADINKELKEKDISPGNYAGTGFLISQHGYVATSYHVVKDADSVYIENKVYGRLRTSVIKADPASDVAILKIDDGAFKLRAPVPFIIPSAEADLGEPVYTLGFPREDIVYGEGTVSAATGFRQQAGSYQIAVPVNPGNSGGPLLSHQGNLVGMISGMHTETAGATFAVKSSVLLNVIADIPSDSLKKPIALPRLNRLKNFDRVQQVKKLTEFVFVVKVYNSK